MVSTTVIKKRPEIDASPQDENIHNFFFIIGYKEAPLSSYKYASEAMRALHMASRRAAFGGLSHALKLVNPTPHFACSFISDIS